MREVQIVGAQADGRDVILGCAVAAVASKGQGAGGELHADLVCSARMEIYTQERKSVSRAYRLVIKGRLFNPRTLFVHNKRFSTGTVVKQ